MRRSSSVVLLLLAPFSACAAPAVRAYLTTVDQSHLLSPVTVNMMEETTTPCAFSKPCAASCSAPGGACATVCGPPYAGGACSCGAAKGCGDHCQTCPECSSCCCTPASVSVAVNTSATFQVVRGFGAALTDSAAYVLETATPAVREQLVQQLFGRGAGGAGGEGNNGVSDSSTKSGIGEADRGSSDWGPQLGLSVLRVSIGVSDFSVNYTIGTQTFDDGIPGSNPCAFSKPCAASCSASGGACATVCGPPYAGGACSCGAAKGCGDHCQTCPECSDCCCAPAPAIGKDWGPDWNLTSFSLARSQRYLLPALRRIRAANPDLMIVGSPWTAPQWLKTLGGGLGGGTLEDSDQAFEAYANYLVRTATEFAAAGAPLAFLTLQNEPGHGGCGTMPCMKLSATQAARLALLVQVGLRAAGLGETTHLLAYDHNWDNIDYPRSLLSNNTAPYNAARAFAGVAWHCYGGDVSSQATLHDEFAAERPELETHMTECSGGSWAPHWADNLLFQQKSLLIGGVNAWSSSVLLWNIFLDEHNGPHCEGGACCTGCRPVVTVPTGATNASQLARHEEYYGLAHHSAFVRPGARRVATTIAENDGGEDDIIAVAYVHASADGGETTTLVVANTQAANVTIKVDAAAGTRAMKSSGSNDGANSNFSFILPQGVVTFVWETTH